jgi:hypothetical protein
VSAVPKASRGGGDERTGWPLSIRGEADIE